MPNKQPLELAALIDKMDSDHERDRKVNEFEAELASEKNYLDSCYKREYEELESRYKVLSRKYTELMQTVKDLKEELKKTAVIS